MSKTDQSERQRGREAAGGPPTNVAFSSVAADSPYITGTVLQVMGGETTGS